MDLESVYDNLLNADIIWMKEHGTNLEMCWTGMDLAEMHRVESNRDGGWNEHWLKGSNIGVIYIFDT